MHSPFCADDETQPLFTTRHVLYTAENRIQIQSQVVLCCKYNVTMRIYTKIQSIVESMISFVRETKREQMFLQTDTSSYVPENRKGIQPVVVFCCKHNIIMRIYTKIQLVVELNLVFLRGYKCTPNPKYSPWLSWTRCFKIQCDSLSGCKS